MLLSQAIQNYLDHTLARGLSPSTHRRYRDDLDNLRAFLGAQNVNSIKEITPQHLRAYFAHLRAYISPKNNQPLSPFSVEGFYRTIQSFFNWLIKEEIINFSDNPFRKIERPKTPKRLVARLSLSQNKQLRDLLWQTVCPERNIALTFCMLDSGMRVGEVLGLKLSDVDLQKGIANVTGKGGKQRRVPLADYTCDAIRGWLAVRPECDNNHLFTSSRDGSPLTHTAVQLMLKRIRNRLGIPKLHPHLLRHSFAQQWLFEMDGDLKTLQEILGHADIRTTAMIYIQPNIEEIKRKHNQSAPSTRLTSADETSDDESCRGKQSD